MNTKFFLGCCLAAALMAAEQHGIVRSGGLPIPGATVVATQDDKKVTTTTDENGNYVFPKLGEGDWTITVEMLGFAKLSRSVSAVAAENSEWDLKLLPVGAPAQEAAATASPRAASIQQRSGRAKSRE